MEDDDEFGDLYSDLIPPSTTSLEPHIHAFKSSHNRPIDRRVASDDEEILYGAPQLKNSNSGLGVELDAPNHGKTLTGKEDRPERGNSDASGIVGGNISNEGSKLPEKGCGELNSMEEDDNLNFVGEETEPKNNEIVEKQADMYSPAERNENVIDYVLEAGQMIPEPSAGMENRGGATFADEWESDESEDDLQIVLNDNNHEQMRIEGVAADGEDGEALVIVADDDNLSHGLQQKGMEERERGGEEGADAERKELGDVAKAAPPMAAQPKIGYSNHMYHQPYHSQFKYVRHGAASSGAASLSLGGAPGQARPPIMLGAVDGHGRDEWQPAGMNGAIPMQMGLQPSYRMPVQGAKAASRLDFTLPSHKTIFEVDIDRFEEKPWRVPGQDVSDFFNFGLNEESWKYYCKKLEQLRLETSMQSKIRVYESVRTDQGYDPDLPPELAAAVGIQGIPSENANPAVAELARGSGRPLIPIGRPIPIETGCGDRLPSIDTRRPRMHDSDAVIEIICQSTAGDGDHSESEQQDNDSAEEHDLQQDVADRVSRAHNGQKREYVAGTEWLKTTVNHEEIGREDSLHIVSEAAEEYQPDRGISFPHNESVDRSVKIPKMTDIANSGEKHVINNQKESFDRETGKCNPRLSSSLVFGTDGDDNDVSVTEDRSFGTEREDMAPGATITERVSQETDEREDYKPSRSSESSKTRSGSSKDQRKFRDTLKDEAHHDRHHPRARNSKRSLRDEDDARRSRHGRDEIRNHIMAVKERADLRSRGGGDSNSSLHRHMKSESTEWRKESDASERSWRSRDEDLQGRRTRLEDTRKREHGGEIGPTNGKRDKHNPRNWDDNLKSHNEKMDDLLNRRRKEGAHINMERAEKEEVKYDQREGSSHRKRERDNSSDQRKADDNAKMKDDGMHNVRQRREESLQRERGGRHRDHDEWRRHKQFLEEKLPRREREDKQSVMRSGRHVEDKTWQNHSQKSDEYRRSGREHHKRDVGRHGEQLRKTNQIESVSFPRDKVREDAYALGNQCGDNVTRERLKRVDRNDMHVVHTSHTLRLYERGQNKESEIGDKSSLISSKQDNGEHIGHISEKVNSRSITKRGSGEDDIHANKHSSGKHGEAASADDFHGGSRRGRSKSGHWSSHKERDSGVTPISASSLKKSKDPATRDSSAASSATKIPEESQKVGENRLPSSDDREDGGEMNMDKHVETVEKLKKHLAKPREKEAVAQAENRPNSATKSVRKTRWTAN